MRPVQLLERYEVPDRRRFLEGSIECLLGGVVLCRKRESA